MSWYNCQKCGQAFYPTGLNGMYLCDDCLTSRISKDRKPKMETILNDILSQRAATYGNFTDNAYVTQSLKRTLQITIGQNPILFTDVQRETLDMMATKLSRIVCGDPNYVDSWVDIMGYCQRALETLNKE